MPSISVRCEQSLKESAAILGKEPSSHEPSFSEKQGTGQVQDLQRARVRLDAQTGTSTPGGLGQEARCLSRRDLGHVARSRLMARFY